MISVFPGSTTGQSQGTQGRKRSYSPRTHKRIVMLQRKVSQYRKALNRIKSKEKRTNTTKQDVLQVMKKFIPPDAYTLLSAQIDLVYVKKHGRRWSEDMKKFATKLYFHSPKAYRFIASVMRVPSVRSIRRWLSNIPMSPGIIPGVISAVAKATENWTRRERACTLMFDEMSLSQMLQYDVAKDEVMGYEDDGKKRTPRISNVAMVVLLSGISRAWVQPIAYAISHNSTPADTIKVLLQEIITKLQTVDIWVKAVICDQGANNVSVATRLNITPEQPYFMVGGERVYFLFDTPHLLKCTRNNLRAHQLEIGKEIIDWSYITELHESSHHLRPKLAPNLTDKHVYKSAFGDMKVKRAAQVMSATVSLALLVLMSLNAIPATAKSTAEFLDRMDKLFDCLNSSVIKKKGQKLRYAISETSEHHQFLQESLQWIPYWKFKGRRQPHTIEGWQVTIKGVLLLWEDLRANFCFRHLMTRRLQQDPLENLFGLIRQQNGCNEHPNAFQFTAGLKHIWISKIMKLSKDGNCEDDTTMLLSELQGITVPAETVNEDTEGAPAAQNQESIHITGESSDIVAENVVFYVGGCIVKEFLARKTDGCVCDRFLMAEDAVLPSGPHQFLVMLKENDVPGDLVSNITIPSEECFILVQRMEELFSEYIGSTSHVSTVCKVLSAVLTLETEIFCCSDCQARFVKLFCLKRLKWHLRFTNRSLKAQRSKHSTAARKMRKMPSAQKTTHSSAKGKAQVSTDSPGAL